MPEYVFDNAGQQTPGRFSALDTMFNAGASLRFQRPTVCATSPGEGRMFAWRGASDGAELMRANFNQMQAEMVAAGYVTEAQFQADVARIDDPKLMWPSSVLWAVQGQRP